MTQSTSEVFSPKEEVILKDIEIYMLLQLRKCGATLVKMHAIHSNGRDSTQVKALRATQRRA